MDLHYSRSKMVIRRERLMQMEKEKGREKWRARTGRGCLKLGQQCCFWPVRSKTGGSATGPVLSTLGCHCGGWMFLIDQYTHIKLGLSPSDAV